MATVTYPIRTEGLTLQSSIERALERAEAAEAERDALKIEMRRIEQDARRQLFSLMRILGVTMDDLLEWKMRQDEKTNVHAG